MTLLVLVALAVPILFVANIVRRVREMSQRLQDPTRLQRVFAETAAAALRRAGGDPRVVAKVEVLRQGAAGAGAPRRRRSGRRRWRGPPRGAKSAVGLSRPARPPGRPGSRPACSRTS